MARNLEKAEYAKLFVHAKVSPETNVDDLDIIPMACDHTSFHSIRRFCKDLRKKLNDLSSVSEGKERVGIDVMCLNAAVLVGENEKPQFTEDDIEVTFQTNHLAPFLIANLTYDLINPGGRVVVTSSGLYAYSTFGSFAGIIDQQSGRARKHFHTISGSQFDHKKSYSESKLCNVAFCLELNRRLQKRNAVAVCFTPGLIPTSGLFRNQKQWSETAMKKRAIGMDETEEWGGCLLAWMAVSDEAGKTGGEFWRAPYGISKRGGSIPKDLFSAELSEEAANPNNQEILWKLSAELTCIMDDLIS